MRLIVTLLLVAATLSAFAQKDRKTRDEESQQKAMQQAMAAMVGNKDCQIADTYAFDHRFSMTMRTWDKKTKEETWIKMRNYVSDKNDIMGIETVESSIRDMPSGTIIFQTEKNQIVTLIDQEGTKMAMCMSMDNPLFGGGKDQSETKKEPLDLKKTGKTKTILGYTCDEWIGEDTDMKFVFWITEKVEIPMYRYLTALGKQKTSPMAFGSNLPEKGMMLMMEGQSKKEGGDKMQMEVTELKPRTKSSISTVGFQRF
jgi:hypothetical protein